MIQSLIYFLMVKNAFLKKKFNQKSEGGDTQFKGHPKHPLKTRQHHNSRRGNSKIKSNHIFIKFKSENQKLREYVLSNTEIQKIVEENKKLKVKVSKFENEEYLGVNDVDLSYKKDLSKFDPYYEKTKNYEKSQVIEDDYNVHKKQDYHNNYQYEKKYDLHESEKNENPYYFQNEYQQPNVDYKASYNNKINKLKKSIQHDRRYQS